MIYSSKQNKTIKEIASLKDKKNRKKLGLYITEGVKTVNEAVKFNMPIVKIVVTEETADKIIENSFETLIVTKEVFEYLSDEVTPQGALAVIKIKDLTPKKPTGNCILLDGVRDPGNMGTIIRTAAALNYKDLYLVNCVDPFSLKVIRASMSGIFFVNVYVGSLEETLSAINGYSLIVGDMGGEDLKTFMPPNKFCIAVGSEADGVSNAVLEKADKTIAIKMQKESESLNVSVALSIMMYNLQ